MKVFKTILAVILCFCLMSNTAYAIVVDGVEYWAYDIPIQYKFDECPTLEEVKNMSMYSSCGLSLWQLEKGLQGELKDLVMAYFDAEGMYGVNAVLKAAQDAFESDWGRNCFQENNISGFFSDIEFKSKEDCIDYTSSRLQIWYLLPTEDCVCPYHSGFSNDIGDCSFGQYHNGTTIYDISVQYCPSENGGINYYYGDKVSQIAYEIYCRAFEVEEN